MRNHYHSFGGITIPLSDAALWGARHVRLMGFDFDGIHTDGTAHLDQSGIESVVVSRKDGLAFDMLRAAGIPACIISKEANPVVMARAKKLNIPCTQSVHTGEGKLEILERFAKEHEIAMENVAYMGDDINDLDVLRAVGFPITVADAHAAVLEVATFITNAPGGRHAIREAVEMILLAQEHQLLELIKKK